MNLYIFCITLKKPVHYVLFMTLYMIGIGLWDENDITIKGLEVVSNSDIIFLENYTSKLGVSIEKLEEFYDSKIILADRYMVEKDSDKILEPAKTKRVAFLVIGDVFSATTHTDLYLRAKEQKIEVIVINNASVLNAVGIVGLELYKYGKTTSIPFHNTDVEAPYDAIKQNKNSKLHTLALLDIDAENRKFMSVNEAIEYLLSVEDKRNEQVFTRETICIGVARLGSPKPRIICGTAEELLKADFGGPLHSLIVPGELHFIEEDALKQWSI
jgi:diphthine synthase